MSDFLRSSDPFERSQMIAKFYANLNELLDKKMFYIAKISEDYKEKNKKIILENAFQKVLSEGKGSDKERF